MKVLTIITVEGRNYMLSQQKMEMLIANASRIGPNGFLKACTRATSLKVIRIEGMPSEYGVSIALEWGSSPLDWLPSGGDFVTVAECTDFTIAQAMYDKTVAGGSIQ